MYKIDGTTIYLIRGDTLIVQLGIKQKNGQNVETYTPAPTDIVRFTLKHSDLTVNKTAYLDKSPLVEKIIPTDTLILRLESTDTKDLDFGKYDYNVEITREDNIVDTFLSGKLYLKAEVD